MVAVLPAGVFLAVDQHRLSGVTDGDLEFKGLGVAAVHTGTDSAYWQQQEENYVVIRDKLHFCLETVAPPPSRWDLLSGW